MRHSQPYYPQLVNKQPPVVYISNISPKKDARLIYRPGSREKTRALHKNSDLLLRLLVADGYYEI